MKKKTLLIIALAVTLLLLIPAIAMQFSNEVSWTLFDFLIAALLLFSAGFGIEFVLRKIKHKNHRLVLILIVLLMLLIIWAELAVGIFGSPISGS